MDPADPIRVLVVDDHADMLFLMRVILGDHGDMRIVAEARSAAEALDAFGRSTPDVAIVDLRMPGPDGLELCRELIRRSPGFPVAVLTSIVDAHIESRALAAGARECASKEELDELPALVRRLAGRAAG